MAFSQFMKNYHLTAYWRCILSVFLLSLYFSLSNSSFPQSPEDSPIDFDNVTTSCEAFFDEYVEAAGNFTHCELFHAKPYRICTKCYEPYAIMKTLFDDLTQDPELHNCMVKYLKSDRVQIIPTMQRYANELWQNSDCTNCVDQLQVDAKTKKVTVVVPQEIEKFMVLYKNMTQCLHTSDMFHLVVSELGGKNMSILCALCNSSYHNLNSHYNTLAKRAGGDVCMDVVDMMNYTRVAWSVNLNCSHRSADATTVIIITIVVALSPLFFYLPLRYTSKEKIKQVLKQKRLGASYDSTLAGTSVSFSSEYQGGRHATPMPRIAS